MKKLTSYYSFCFYVLALLVFSSCQAEKSVKLQNDPGTLGKLLGGSSPENGDEKLQQIMTYNFAHLVTPQKSRCSSLFLNPTQLATAAHCFVDYQELENELTPKIMGANFPDYQKKQIIKNLIMEKIGLRKKQLRIYQNLAATNYQTDYQNSLPIQQLLLPRLYGQVLLYHLYYRFKLPTDDIPQSIRGSGLIADFAYVVVDSNYPRYHIPTLTGSQLVDMLDFASQSQENYLTMILISQQQGENSGLLNPRSNSYSKVFATTYLFLMPSYDLLTTQGKAFDLVVATAAPSVESINGDSGAPYLYKVGKEYFLAGIHNGTIAGGKNLQLIKEYGHNMGLTLSMVVDDSNFWNVYDVVSYELLFQ